MEVVNSPLCYPPSLALLLHAANERETLSFNRRKLSLPYEFETGYAVEGLVFLPLPRVPRLALTGYGNCWERKAIFIRRMKAGTRTNEVNRKKAYRGIYILL